MSVYTLLLNFPPANKTSQLSLTWHPKLGENWSRSEGRRVRLHFRVRIIQRSSAVCNCKSANFFPVPLMCVPQSKRISKPDRDTEQAHPQPGIDYLRRAEDKSQSRKPVCLWYGTIRKSVIPSQDGDLVLANNAKRSTNFAVPVWPRQTRNSSILRNGAFPLPWGSMKRTWLNLRVKATTFGAELCFSFLFQPQLDSSYKHTKNPLCAEPHTP